MWTSSHPGEEDDRTHGQQDEISDEAADDVNDSEGNVDELEALARPGQKVPTLSNVNAKITRITVRYEQDTSAVFFTLRSSATNL